MGREKPAEYWFPGPVRSALRVLRAVKILSWMNLCMPACSKNGRGACAPECEVGVPHYRENDCASAGGLS